MARLPDTQSWVTLVKLYKKGEGGGEEKWARRKASKSQNGGFQKFPDDLPRFMSATKWEMLNEGIDGGL